MKLLDWEKDRICSSLKNLQSKKNLMRSRTRNKKLHNIKILLNRIIFQEKALYWQYKAKTFQLYINRMYTKARKAEPRKWIFKAI